MHTRACAGAAAQIASRSSTLKAESKNTCDSQTRSHEPERAAAMKRSAKVRHGSAAISVATTRPASWSRRVCRRKLWNSAAPVSTLVLDRLDVDAQEHVVGEHRNAVFHAEVAAPDARAQVRAADLLLEHRVGSAEEVLDLEGRRPRDAVDGELARGGGELVAVELELAR